MSKIWSLAAILVLSLLAFTFAFRSCVDSAAGLPGAMLRGAGASGEKSLQNISSIFKEAFQLTPTIVQNNTIILHQSAPIAEFAVLKKEGSYQFSWLHTWMGSQKKIEVKGNYRAKAGFDLSQPFTVTLQPDGSVRADLPPAAMLSFEKIGELDFADSNGWFNKVTSEERRQVLNQFEKKARDEMLASGLLAEAEAQALDRLREIARRNGQEMVFRYRRDTSTPAPSP